MRLVHVFVACLALLPSGARAGVAPVAGAQGPVAFFMEEMLFHPRADGVTLALQPAEPAELFVEYGVAGGAVFATPTRRGRAGQLVPFELDGLWPDGEFLYRVLARRPGEPEFRPRDVHGFRTARSPGSTVRFAVAADTHAFALWSRHACALNPSSPYATLQNTLARLRDDDALDFVVAGSDSAMTRCGGGCVPCEVGGLPTSGEDADDQLDARLRYRQVFGPEIFGVFGPERPMLYVFGDHDGEQGWGGDCNLAPELLQWSAAARREFVPAPAAVYSGDPAGRYYAMTSGDVLLVVLDPLSRTPPPLDTPESFTLGARQLDWFEQTLKHSDATFKIVMAEHILGGVSGPAQPCWKGRGGIRSTDSGLPTGTFLGEQALVHELMKAHGAQLYLSFHDHVVAYGEKPGPDGLGEGVVYAIGGRASGVGHSWANQDWYRTAMDYDLDGVPEYETGVTGTRATGWFEVTAQGSERLELRYRASAPGMPDDGEVLLGFDVAPGGGLLSVGGVPAR